MLTSDLLRDVWPIRLDAYRSAESPCGCAAVGSGCQPLNTTHAQPGEPCTRPRHIPLVLLQPSLYPHTPYLTPMPNPDAHTLPHTHAIPRRPHLIPTPYRNPIQACWIVSLGCKAKEQAALPPLAKSNGIGAMQDPLWERGVAPRRGLLVALYQWSKKSYKSRF